jgi:capsular exopolysaccharide synthesis family protein
MSATGHQRLDEQAIVHYLAVVKRYKWLILAATLLVPLAVYFVSTQQTKVYRATAEVLLDRHDIGATITGLPTQSAAIDDPTRYARTQAQLARVPAVRRAAVDKAGVGDVDASELGKIATVSENTDSDILTFAVDHGDPSVAERLATAYARAFAGYRLQSDTASLAQARAEIQGRLSELRDAGAAGTDTYRVLLGQAQNLRTLELLLAPARVIRTADDDAEQIAPTPRRNALLAAVLGLFLGVGAAFGLGAIDRRIRHADQVEHELQIPLLAKVPSPRRSDAATILEHPPDETTEAVARLRASFDFVNQNVGAKTVMVTSAGPREGKSTTIANLAITQARTGRHVVLVDLDLRRPMLSRVFHLADGAGITDFAARDTELVDVLQSVAVTPLRPRVSPIAGTSPDIGHGRLEVVTAGRTRVEPSAFVESTGLTEALHALRSHAELVLIDAPPILATGDAMALTGKVDAVLLITRLGSLTRPTLQELGRVLRRSPAPVLGLVATGAEVDEAYSVYAVDEYYSQARPVPEAPATAQTRLEEVPEVRSASAASGRWTPRRGR